MSRPFIDNKLYPASDYAGEVSLPRARYPRPNDLTEAHTPLHAPEASLEGSESLSEAPSDGEGYGAEEADQTQGSGMVIAGTESSHDASLHSPGVSVASEGKAFLRATRPGTFGPGNTAAKAKRPKLATLGVDVGKIDVKHPKYRAALRRAEGYVDRRSKELSKMFGGCSAAVGAILGTASLQLAAARFLTEVAAERSDEIGVFLELQKIIGKLGDGAARNEILAYELCAKEAGLKAKAVKDQPAWLVSKGPEALDADPE